MRATRCCILLASVATALLAMAAVVAGQEGDRQEAPPPKAVEVEAYVIMASHGEKPHVDPKLKEIAELLEGVPHFNRFHYHDVVDTDVELKKAGRLPLVANYFLEAGYNGIERREGKPDRLLITLTPVKSVEVEKDGKKTVKYVPVTSSISFRVPWNVYVPVVGPEVEGKTVIMAVRITE